MRRLLIAVAVVALSGCGGSGSTSLPQGGEHVELDPADFVAQIDNPYWPMAAGSAWVYREGDERVVVTVTNRKKEILGIPATIVHDVVREEGELVEDTSDWYAQDADGNVWYLGEDTKEYEHGKLKSTEGSWEAGVDGAEAGVVVPAEPEVGLTYRQEYYRGEAEDAARVLSLDEQVDVPSGHFTRVLMTKDYTPLEPSVLEHKFYAKGVGPVLTLTIAGGAQREELTSFKRR